MGESWKCELRLAGENPDPGRWAEAFIESNYGWWLAFPEVRE